jgi:hypothetical protein
VTAKFLMPRFVQVQVLICFAVIRTNAQPVASCTGGSLATASVEVTAISRPANPTGLRIAIIPVASKGRGVELQYKVGATGKPVKFGDICPGKYSVIVRGAGISDCGYFADKDIVLHEKEARRLKLTVKRKRGSIWE